MKENNVMRYMLLGIMFLILPVLACGIFGGDPADERVEENEALVSGAELGEVVMAEGIGRDNVPLDITNDFSASQDYIYVVVEADYIEGGTTMFARWYYEDEPVEDSPQITADRDYEDTYVEFHLENLVDEFEEGDYAVEIFVNGNPAESIEFTVN